MKSLFEHLQDFMEKWSAEGSWGSSSKYGWTAVDQEGRYASGTDLHGDIADGAPISYDLIAPHGAPIICLQELLKLLDHKYYCDGEYKYNRLNLDYMGLPGGKIESSENADNLAGKQTYNPTKPGQGLNAGGWAVQPHMAPDSEEMKAWRSVSPENYSENLAKVKDAWRAIKGSNAKEPGFAVIGQAGWGKSEIMTKEARNAGYDVIVVNLAMAASEDVLGIPVPDRLASGQLKTEYAAPGWLAYVAQHPDDKICIFFDEFNQASRDVLGTIQNFLLTKTVNGVQYPNIRFMAAGNEKSENSSLVDINSLPAVRDRFKMVRWKSDWAYYFNWHRQNYEKVFGKAFMDEMDANKESFSSPRNLTLHVFGWLEEVIADLKKDPTDLPIYTGDFILHNILYEQSTAKWNEAEHRFEKPSDSQALNLSNLADYIAKYIYDAVTGSSTNTGSEHTFGSKGRTTMEKSDIQRLRDMMQTGYIVADDGNTYGICKENIMYVFDESIYPAEVVERTVETLEKVEGIKWKYTTKKQCKAGCKKEKISDNIEVDLDKFVADDKGNITEK